MPVVRVPDTALSMKIPYTYVKKANGHKKKIKKYWTGSAALCYLCFSLFVNVNLTNEYSCLVTPPFLKA